MQQDLIDKISEDSTISKSGAKRIVESFFEYFTENLKKGENVIIQHFGTFRLGYKGPYTGRNPFNGEDVEIPEKISVRFKASSKLKDEVQSALEIVKEKDLKKEQEKEQQDT